jgi:flagellar hook-associated protein 1 FlgK
MSSVNMFNTGKSALFANKAALATTGHNIANVNTEGYTRQRVELTAADPHAAIGKSTTGTGVRIDQVIRINDEYLDRQIFNEQKYLGAYEERDYALSQVEAIFNETQNEGLNRLVSNFFNEFRKLGNQPENESMRLTVRESSTQLISDFKRIHRTLKDIQKNLDSRIESDINHANDLIKRVSHLNTEIRRMEMSGGQSGDLRDKRDLAVKQLSNMLGTSVSTNEHGEYNVGMGGVGVLVSGPKFTQFKTEFSKGNYETGKPENSVSILIENLLPPDVTHRFGETGRVGGLVDARDNVIGGILNRMDQLAYSFATKINQVHRQGYGLDGGTGRNFFEEPTKIENASDNLELADEIKEDVSAIAAAITPNAPGDNRLVQRLTALQFERNMAGGKSTFDDFYNATVADMATIHQKNKLNFQHQKSVMSQLEKFRESVSGVSIDEETTNLIQFQHAFDAAAKVIKVADEMLDTVLSLRR